MPTPTDLTGRPAHPFARYGHFKLGFNLPQGPIRPPRPRPDMATTVTFTGHATTVAQFERHTSAADDDRVTSVTPDF